MPDLFKEIIPSILQTKQSVLHDDIDLKDYTPFIVNKALSYHIDCIFYVNELNMHPNVDKDMQYQYLMNSIRQMKRKFQPWHKKNTEEDIEHVKVYFGYSYQKAKQAMAVLTDDQINHIREKTIIGGVPK